MFNFVKHCVPISKIFDSKRPKIILGQGHKDGAIDGLTLEVARQFFGIDFCKGRNVLPVEPFKHLVRVPPQLIWDRRSLQTGDFLECRERSARHNHQSSTCEDMGPTYPQHK